MLYHYSTALTVRTNRPTKPSQKISLKSKDQLENAETRAKQVNLENLVSMAKGEIKDLEVLAVYLEVRVQQANVAPLDHLEYVDTYDQ